MKKFLFIIPAIACLFSSCSNQKEHLEIPKSVNQTLVESENDSSSVEATVEESAPSEEVSQESSAEMKAAQQKACAELKSWGAKDAYVDDNGYLVYVVNKSEITASGNEVAKSMYELVGEVPGVKGVRVVDHKSKAELGKY